MPSIIHFGAVDCALSHVGGVDSPGSHNTTRSAFNVVNKQKKKSVCFTYCTGLLKIRRLRFLGREEKIHIKAVSLLDVAWRRNQPDHDSKLQILGSEYGKRPFCSVLSGWDSDERREV